MRHHGLIPLLLCIAATTANECTAAPLSIGTRNETIPENGTVTYTVVKTGQNDLSFLPPPGWKAEADAKANTLTWTSPDYLSMIRLKISEGEGDAIPKLNADELRQTISQELENSKITEEFPCYTSGSTGLAFDSERAVGDKFLVKSRIAFIPVPGGFARITLTAPREEFRTRQMDFSRFLNSFRITRLKTT